jgi:acyl-CoA reductase-like NAD-dependent aldehyde dehydrogenase
MIGRLDAVIFMIYSLNGQRCTSSSRLFIHNDIREEFLQDVRKRVETLVVGPPLDPATEVGPLIHEGHLKKVMHYLNAAGRRWRYRCRRWQSTRGLGTGQLCISHPIH